MLFYGTSFTAQIESGIATFFVVCAVVCFDSILQVVHAFQKQAGIFDGKPFLQYRFTFTGDHVTGQVPSVDALVIPVN